MQQDASNPRLFGDSRGPRRDARRSRCIRSRSRISPRSRHSARQGADGVVCAQSHEDVVVRGIGGDRMRGAGGMTGTRGDIICCQLLQDLLVLRIDDTERGGALRRRSGERPERTAAAGGVVIAIAGVEPPFIAGPYAENTRVDASVFRVNDYVVGRCSDRTRRIPDNTCRVEDRIAADRQVYLRAAGEPGRAAEVDPPGVGCRFTQYCPTRSVGRDADNATVRDRRADLRDRDIEQFGAGIPHWLLGAALRIDAIGRIEQNLVRGSRLGQDAA